MRQGFEGEIDYILTDVLSLRKPDGREFESVRAHVAAQGILLTDVQLPLEVGDTLIRLLPNGLREEFVVDDPRYTAEVAGFPAHFMAQVHRAPPKSAETETRCDERAGILPRLPESAMRRLTLQYEELLDRNQLTGKHIDSYTSADDRTRRLATSTLTTSGRWSDGWVLAHEDAMRKTGITASTAVAKAWFKVLAREYWAIWASTGANLDVYVGQLQLLKCRVGADICSVWERSDASRRWFESACAPLIDGDLDALVTEGTREARLQEIRHLPPAPASTGNPVLDEIYAAGGDSEEGLRLLSIESGAKHLSLSAQKALQQARLARRASGEDSGSVARPGDQEAQDELLRILDAVLERQNVTIETWARDQHVSRTTLFAWKRWRTQGGSPKGKISAPKIAEIENAIRHSAKTLGLPPQTCSD